MGFIGFVCAGDVSAWMEEVRFDQPTQTTPALDLTNGAEIVLLATFANYFYENHFNMTNILNLFQESQP